MFSGLLVCADCGGNLNYHFNQKNPAIKYFNCANNNSSRKTCPTTHYIRVDFLEQAVLGEIHRLTRFAVKYEDEFAEAVMGHSEQAATEQRKTKQRELNAMLARDNELDSLFEKIYEDNAGGKLTDERFMKMSRRYEEEQGELALRIKALKAELDKENNKAMTADMFISTVRKYTRAKKLSERMLNELVERIEVHHAEKVDGEYRQKLTIHYNCVGSIEIPGIVPFPEPAIRLNTRKGVVVSYTPAQQAV